MKAGRTTVFRPTDIQAVRATLGASQSEFALMIGVSVATLRNWEQGRRSPDGPALAQLRVAAKNPDAVVEALHGARGASESREDRRAVRGQSRNHDGERIRFFEPFDRLAVTPWVG
jgi:putative transcriptional regulator